MKALVQGVFFVAWLFGIVLSNGWWAVLAFFIPFYSFYVVVKHFAIMAGLV